MTLQEFWDSDEELAIHCDTEEKLKILCEEFGKMGKRWSNGASYFEFYDYLTFQEYTCLSNTNEYGPISYFIDDNIKVIEFDEIEDFKTNNNPVNHPSHYNDGNIEVIDFIEDKKLGFHLGNAVKYISRAGKKDVSKTREDIEKAIWYLERYLEVTKNDK